MIKQPNVKDAIKFLNEILARDERAISELFLSKRVECNLLLADHPTVQVIPLNMDYGLYDVGILGILNGLFGVYPDGPKKGWGPIAMMVDKNRIKHFLETVVTEVD